LNEPIKLIVGLGNPGQQYAETRHNAGCWFIQELAAQYNATFRTETKFKGLTCQININNHNCWLLFPITYMNNCGEAVKALANFYHITAEEILIVHDELDFAPGVIRLKQDGSHGGHNGLRNIISHLHSNQFYRLRIGIGHPGDKNAVLDYVLGRPRKSEQKKILQAITKGLEVISDIVLGNIEKATRVLHGI
jgi:PTH1 family peptidyl-tRNA hydrolase